MSDEAIIALLQQTPLSFVGTIEHLGAATMDVPIDDRTAVAYVDRVLHGPDTLLGLDGQRVTLQLASAGHPVEVGHTAAFFVQVLALGDSVALAEVGRLPLEEVEPQMRRAAEAGERAFAALEHQVEAISLSKHANDADAVVLGRVVKLEKASPLRDRGFSEHDADWWVATLDVYHVERGEVEVGKVRVLYANSTDVRWRDAPKPEASQGGLWLLHQSEPERVKVAPFEMRHAQDWQPVQSLDAIRNY